MVVWWSRWWWWSPWWGWSQWWGWSWRWLPGEGAPPSRPKTCKSLKKSRHLKLFSPLLNTNNFKLSKLSWTQMISNFQNFQTFLNTNHFKLSSRLIFSNWFATFDSVPKVLFSVFVMDCLFWHDAGYERRTIGPWSFYWGDGFHYTFTKESGTNSECVFCQTESHRKIRRIHTNCGSKWYKTK